MEATGHAETSAKEWQLLCALKTALSRVINLADQWRSAIVTRFTGAPVRLGFAF